MRVKVVDVEPEKKTNNWLFCSPNSTAYPMAGFLLVLITFLFFFVIGCSYVAFYLAQHIVSFCGYIVLALVNLIDHYSLNSLKWFGQMEEHYVTIVYVELRPNIFIPFEWPIQGIDGLVLFLAKKIIEDPGPMTYVLQVDKIPAKLIRRPTESGFVYIFQKVTHEEVVGAYLYDVVFPIDEYSVGTDIASGKDRCRGLCLNYCASASPIAKKVSYQIIPPRFNNKTYCSTGVNDPALRHCTTSQTEGPSIDSASLFSRS